MQISWLQSDVVEGEDAWKMHPPLLWILQTQEQGKLLKAATAQKELKV